MEPYQTVKILKIKGNVHKQITDRVITEAVFKVYINGKKEGTFYCTPKNLRELAVGYLYQDGLITDVNEILSTDIGDNNINIKLKEDMLTEQYSGKYNIDKNGNPVITPAQVFRIIKNLSSKSNLFKKTGGTHNALISSARGDNLLFREDVSRNNTINKIIGNILINNINPVNKILAVSSRVSYTILHKIAKIAIPVIISISAPTDKAIDLAEKSGITLIAFVREDKMNVYTHKQRVNLKRLGGS